MSTGNGNDTDVKAMQAELRELRARVRTLEAEKRRPTLEGHGARVQAIAAEAAALQPLKEAAAATAPASAAALALGPSVRLEYTRDSPMFRKQCEAFENSLAGLDSLLGGLAIRLRDWSAALRASRDARSAADQSRRRIARPPSRLSRPASEFSKASHCFLNMGLSLVYSNRTLGPSASAAAEAGAVAAAASLSGWRAAASAAMACTRAPWPSKVGRRFSASSVRTLARSSLSSACIALTSVSFPLPVDMAIFYHCSSVERRACSSDRPAHKPRCRVFEIRHPAPSVDILD